MTLQLISESPDFGVKLGPLDVETADAFEDFLNEDCYALFHFSTTDETVSFHFGVAACPEKVELLWKEFLGRSNA